MTAALSTLPACQLPGEVAAQAAGLDSALTAPRFPVLAGWPGTG